MILCSRASALEGDAPALRGVHWPRDQFTAQFLYRLDGRIHIGDREVTDPFRAEVPLLLRHDARNRCSLMEHPRVTTLAVEGPAEQRAVERRGLGRSEEHTSELQSP